MAEPGQAIFKKVAVSDKKLLFREIASDRVQVSLKGLEDEVFHLMVIQFERDEHLLCHHTADSKKFEKPQKVMVNFPFKSERYFFQSELSFNSGWAVLTVESDLYQLQRRSNARIDIPKEYDGVFTLHQHKGKNYFLESQIKDISVGGVKAVLPFVEPELAIGDKVTGTIRLATRRVMEFEMEVRFSQKKDFKGKWAQIVGLQFLNVDQLLENRLMNLMMDLQREIFVKYKGKR